MEDERAIKKLVKEKYAEIAESACCCGSAADCCSDYTSFSEDYTGLAGYNPAADLKLGCGIPTAAARIRSGDVVVDLGSGAGNDAFVARALVGEKGWVIGIDMAEAMIEKARRNAQALNLENVEFRLGEIENLPIADGAADVVISNCVLNLVPDKARAFTETYRILKAGGHFSISDVVLTQDLPACAKSAAELYAGCVAGALLRKDYLALIEQAGFENVQVLIEKPLPLPEESLRPYMSGAEFAALDTTKPLALSITVYGERPK